MKTMERQLSEDLVYLMNKNEDFKLIEKKYDDYKTYLTHLEMSDIPKNELLEGVVDKIYKDYDDERKTSCNKNKN